MKAKYRSLDIVVACAILMASSVFGAPAAIAAKPPSSSSSSGDKEIVIARVATGNEVLELAVPESTLTQKRAASPRALRDRGKEQFIENLKAQCGQKKGMIREVLHEFPADAGAFYAGLAFSSESEIRKDPAAFRHFAEQNLLDPKAHVSFAFFMLGNSATNAALAFMGLHFDPCKRVRDGNLFVTKENPLTGKKTYNVQPTALQKKARHLVGPLSMTGGFMLSSMVGEFMADPNIALCSQGQVQKYYADMSQEEIAAREEACDKAYEDWVVEGKIKNYVPDLLSMVGTSFIQGYFIHQPMAAGRAKLIDKLEKELPGLALRAASTGQTTTYRITLNSIRILQSVGSAHPLVQFGFKAANALVFLTINEIILPYFKNPWERKVQGTAITASINEIFDEIARTEKNGWVWKPKPKPAACDYEPTPMEIGNGYFHPTECYEPVVEIDKQVSKLGQRFKKWREFILADAYLAHSNWKDYLSRFQQKYTDAQRFYSTFLYSMAWQKTTGVRGDELVDMLYRPSPFNGLEIQVPAKICTIAPDDLKKVNAAALIAKTALTERKEGRLKTKTASEIEWLEKIALGLKALDCSEQLSGVRPILEQGRTNGVSVLREEWSAIENKIRARRFTEALDALTQAVGEKSFYNDYGLNPKSSNYAKIVSSNPFAAIKSILGSPQPLPPGRAFLSAMNNANEVISQETKHNHPGGIGYMARARTLTMADYLLGQMICGPEVDPSKAVKVSPYNEKKQSRLTKALNYLTRAFYGFDPSDLTRRIEDNDSMIYVQYADRDSAESDAKTNAVSASIGSEMIPSIWGIRVDFKPPKIIADVGYDFCADHRKGAQKNSSEWDIHTTEFNVGGEKIKGYLEVVKRFARPEIIGADKDSFNFPKWWEQNVDAHVTRVLDLYRGDFVHIIDTDFLPRLTGSDSVVYNGRKFETGIARSLESEAQFNLTLIGKSYLKSDFGGDNGGSRTARARFHELADEFKKHLRLQTMLFSDLHTAQKAVATIELIANGETIRGGPKSRIVTRTDDRFMKAFEANKTILGMILDDLGKLTNVAVPKTESKVFQAAKSSEESRNETPGSDLALKPEALETLKKIRTAALGNLAALVTETDSYFGVVDTVRVEGLK